MVCRKKLSTADPDSELGQVTATALHVYNACRRKSHVSSL